MLLDATVSPEVEDTARPLLSTLGVVSPWSVVQVDVVLGLLSSEVAPLVYIDPVAPVSVRVS